MSINRVNYVSCEYFPIVHTPSNISVTVDYQITEYIIGNVDVVICFNEGFRTKVR
ncbi:MAG: hypothetical protein DSY87_04580 [Methylococcus sp.]|nr:DUF4845 domain-containing protein [Methylococcales bacterium]RUM53121.1 MAG: hypothetical protein DSY87_04580 [Methylococcus sp.]